MLSYPSILGCKDVSKGHSCIGFYKYDGSNLRFEYSHKRGWHKFGSRTQLINENTSILGEGVSLFLSQNIGDIVIDRLKSEYGLKQFKAMEKITAFAEFFGDNSFAGTHQADDPKQLKLFDISLYKKGFILPKQFANMFSTDIGAEVVYEGYFNNELIQKVRDNDLDVVLNEGIICKGNNDAKVANKYGPVWMTKIKTQQYLNRLKAVYQDEWEKFAE